jgi:hypothetical protein
MDLRSVFPGGQGRLTIGLGLVVLAGVVAIGIAAGRSESDQGAGATGASGPTGKEEASRSAHRPHRRTAPQKPREVRVPNVVGQSEEAAATELADHDLSGHFAGPGNAIALVCAEAAPGARVIGQFPESGARARAGQRVGIVPSAYAQTGCGRPSAPRTCDPSELSLNVSESKPDYTGGGEDSLAVATVTHVGGKSACAVDSTLTISIGQSDGELLGRVAGNPMTVQLHASLDVGDKMVAGWLLGSWCGSRRDVVATAGLEGLEAIESLKELPYGATCPSITLYSLYKARRPGSRS